MLLSYWRSYSEAGRVIVCAAIAAVALAVLVAIPHAADGPSGEGPNQASQRNGNKKHWEPHFSPAEPYSAYQNADCQSPKDREEADLCQQWRVAEASEKAVALADSQWLWNVTQAVSTVLAALATAWAAVKAGDAANAAQLSARVAQRALTDLERPFVTTSSLNVAYEADKKVLRAGVSWRNGGNTPAKKCFCYFSIASFFPGELDEFDFRDMKGAPPTKLFVGPGAVINSTTVDLPEASMIMAASGAKTIAMWGWIEYDDIFQDTPRHRTEFCSLIRVTVPFHKMPIVPLVYKDHNGMDDDCPADRYRTIKGGLPNPAFKPHTS